MSVNGMSTLFCKAVRALVWSLLLLGASVHAAWAAITLVGSTSNATGNAGAGDLTLAYPAGLQLDDILIAQIAVRGNRNITPPAGWTLINRTVNSNELTQAVYLRRAGATNPVAEWEFSNSDRAGGSMIAYRGVDPVVPVNVFSANTSTSASVTASSVTPTVTDTQLVGLFALARGGSGFTPPAGMSEHEDLATAGNNGITVALTDEAYAGGTAATGNRTAIAEHSNDGIAHLVALQPNVIASYHMDEAAWTGASGQVTDSSGRSHHASAVNGATTGGTMPAISGTPGTCNYGMFDGSNDYVAVPPSFPNLVTDFTITAWIRTTNNAKSGQRIFIDDQNNSGGYGLSLGDGGAGMVRFYARATNPVILDTPNVIANNTWYFVAAVMNAATMPKTKRIYVYNQAGTQLASVVQTYTGNWGTDAGAASLGGENNASGESGANFKFSGNLDEVNVFSGALTSARLLAVMNQTRPCSIAPPVTPSGFNAFETTTAAGSISGVIRTKVAASAFAVDVVALNTTATAVETAFTGAVGVELVNAAGGGACGAYPLIRDLGTLTFAAGDQGRKTLAGIGEPEAWPNVRVRIRYPATGMATIVACSGDNLAIRPAYFNTVTVSDANSVTAGVARALTNTLASGGIVHKAGRPFRIAATARNAAGATTANYAGTPVASPTACLLPASGCTLGVLAPGAWSAASGVLTTSTASYSEVGAFSMTLVDANFAAVDAADGSTAAERTIESAVFSVGRFVPDHFVLTTASTPQFKTFNDTSCGTRSFTYVGQPFGYLVLPQATITAKNASGATTLNYAGALWKLAAADATQTYTAASGSLDTGVLGTPDVTAASGGTGTLAAHADDVIAFVRSTPVAPFAAAIELSMGIRDLAENGVSGNGTIETTTPAVFANIAFDAGDTIRFGRLVLANAHGSELLGLPVPIETQFWDGSHFVRNAADACTQFSANQVTLSNWRRDLNPCETSVTLSGRFNAGRGSLRLSAPGDGNTGSVDLSLNLGVTGSGNACVGGASVVATGATQRWLQGAWSGAAYDQNPAARASFGLYRGSRALIYMREMY